MTHVVTTEHKATERLAVDLSRARSTSDDPRAVRAAKAPARVTQRAARPNLEDHR